MNFTSFEMTVSVQDDRFAGAVRVLVTSVAAQAGCGAPAAEAFAAAVEVAVRQRLLEVSAGVLIPIVVRRQDGPVEVLVDGHTLTLEV